MQGPWRFPFPLADTFPAPFTLTNGSAISVAMMRMQTGSLDLLFLDECYCAVRLPFQVPSLSALVICAHRYCVVSKPSVQHVHGRVSVSLCLDTAVGIGSSFLRQVPVCREGMNQVPFSATTGLRAATPGVLILHWHAARSVAARQTTKCWWWCRRPARRCSQR